MPDAPVETPAANEILAGLSPEARGKWRETGVLPEPEPPTNSSKPADSTPAQPAEQAAPTGASEPPASEPGTPKKPNAETRKADLQTEILDLLRQKKQLQAELARPSADRPASTSDAKAASSPAVEVPSLSSLLASPPIDAPPLTDAEFYARYPEASIADFARYVARDEIARERASTAAETESKAKMARFAERLKPALTADPEWITKTDAIASIMPVSLLKPTDPRLPENYAAEEVMLAEHPAEVMLHLATHPEALKAIRDGSPLDAIRTIVRLDATLGSASVPPSPAVVPTSAAPAPPAVVVGRKPTAPVNEVEAAIKDNDFRRYKQAVNRREVAS